MDLPTFGGHPRRGALREVMVKILPQENLATQLSQVEAWVSFQGIWEMLPNATTYHPCARTLVPPLCSVWTMLGHALKWCQDWYGPRTVSASPI